MEEDFKLFQEIKKQPIRNCVGLSRNMRGKRSGVFYFIESFRIDFENKMSNLARLEDENEELNYKYHKSLEDIVVLSKNSIPKEKIENLIQELKNQINQNDKMINEYRSTLKENELEKIAKIDKARFDNTVYYNEINLLQVLLEEEK